MGVLAFGTVGTEACKVEKAEFASDVSLRTDGPEGAETFVVVWAGWELGGGVEVEVQAFISIRTKPILSKEITFWHLS